MRRVRLPKIGPLQMDPLPSAPVGCSSAFFWTGYRTTDLFSGSNAFVDVYAGANVFDWTTDDLASPMIPAGLWQINAVLHIGFEDSSLANGAVRMTVQPHGSMGEGRLLASTQFSGVAGSILPTMAVSGALNIQEEWPQARVRVWNDTGETISALTAELNGHSIPACASVELPSV